jgi:hypothetical protein
MLSMDDPRNAQAIIRTEAGNDDEPRPNAHGRQAAKRTARVFGSRRLCATINF